MTDQEKAKLLTVSLRERVAAEQQDELLCDLLSDLKVKLKMSRNDMSHKYPVWDKHLATFAGEKEKTTKDEDAEALGEPESMVVPLSYAQVQTFVAFGFLLILQNKRVYEFEPSEEEEHELNEACETIVQSDLEYNRFPSLLYQFLLDFARFGMAVTKECWKVEKQTIEINNPTEIPASVNPETGLTTATRTETPSKIDIELTKFEGNVIYTVSPYSFLPDTRLPLSRWREGQFAADETERHITWLKDLEAQGIVFGVEHVSKMDKASFSNRGKSRLPRLEKCANNTKTDEDDFMTVVTEVQAKLVPWKYALGQGTTAKEYLIRIANDQRIVSIEPMNYLHGEFTYNVALISPDQHMQMSMSLCDVSKDIQAVVDFLFNSRIYSIRQGIERHMVVDPSAVEIASIESRSPVIYLKKTAPRTGVDKFVQQLQYQDKTNTHFDEADVMMKLMQLVTGVNENAMGQYAPGRRSATENRAANAGAASRMKMIVMLAWHDAFGPMGRKLLLNARQMLTLDTYRKVLGAKADETWPLFRPSDPSLLVGNRDQFVFDATLQSEKGYLAQSLQELIVSMASNQELAMAQGFDFNRAIKELQYLRGINNATRFFRPELAQIPTQIPVGGAVPGGTEAGVG